MLLGYRCATILASRCAVPWRRPSRSGWPAADCVGPATPWP